MKHPIITCLCMGLCGVLKYDFHCFVKKKYCVFTVLYIFLQQSLSKSLIREKRREHRFEKLLKKEGCHTSVFE